MLRELFLFLNSMKTEKFAKFYSDLKELYCEKVQMERNASWVVLVCIAGHVSMGHDLFLELEKIIL